MDDMLEYFIVEPEREFHVRELAKLSKKSPTTTSKYLNKLKKERLLISRRKFNHLLFKANNENLLFKDVKRSYNIRKLRESGLMEYLIEEFKHPEAIVLFGSFVKGEDIPKSDVDILVITSLLPLLGENSNLIKFERKLGHKIQLFVHNNKEIDKMKIKNKGLVNNWINGTVLDGYWELYK